jgi:hypothetical protein
MVSRINRGDPTLALFVAAHQPMAGLIAVPTLLSLSRGVLRSACMGHEDAFPRRRPNGRCRIQKRSVAADDSRRGLLRQALN